MGCAAVSDWRPFVAMPCIGKRILLLAYACLCSSAAQVDENTRMGQTLGTAILNANRKLRGLHAKSDQEALSFLAGIAEEMGGEQEVLRNAAVERIAQQANS